MKQPYMVTPSNTDLAALYAAFSESIKLNLDWVELQVLHISIEFGGRMLCRQVDL